MADLSKVEGLADLLKYFAASPANLHVGVHVGLYAGAKLIEAEAKSRCPVAEGSLRDTIRATIRETDKKIIATVQAGNDVVDYAKYIEFSGARPHVERDVSIAGRTYAEVHHPGMRPHPFLRPALDAKELAAVAEVDKQVEAALK